MFSLKTCFRALGMMGDFDFNGGLTVPNSVSLPILHDLSSCYESAAFHGGDIHVSA